MQVTKGSGGLAPSKSTVYVSNLDFSLTNNDIHQLLDKYGQIAKVTIVRDKETRQSKGVAFVLFVRPEDAHACAKAMNDTEFYGRTLKCSIAKDNGRAREFIKRKDYTDKSRCFECGEFGHLSYKCPKNLLGERQPPNKDKKKKRKRKRQEEREQEQEQEQEDEEINFDSDDEDSRWNRIQASRKAQLASKQVRLEQVKSSTEDHRTPSHHAQPPVSTSTGVMSNLDRLVALRTAERAKAQKKSESYFSDDDEEGSN